MARLSRWSIGTWLMVIGLIVALSGIIAVVATIGPSATQVRQLSSIEHLPLSVLVLLAVVALGLLLFVIGMMLYVLVPSFSHQQAERGYGSIGTILACMGTAIVFGNVILLPYFLVFNPPASGAIGALTPAEIVLSVLALDLSFLVVVYLRIVHPKVMSWSEMGLTDSHIGRMILLGIGVGVAALVISGAASEVLRLIGIDQTQSQEFAGIKNAPFAQFAGVLLAGSVVAPICEEIFFRGYVFTALSRTRGLVAGYIGSSLLFALAHTNVQAFVPILLIGFLFSYVYHRTGSLAPSMTAHLVNNALAFLAFYFGSK